MAKALKSENPGTTPLSKIVRVLKTHGLSLENTSCYICFNWRTCEYAFDTYNTHGDCLASK